MNDLKEEISIRDLTSSSTAAVTEPDYSVWKEAKIRKALAQAQDRALMIPAGKVWERYGFER